jgi:hypothetical protein
MITNERDRYYSAAASARDPDLARETLALTLTDELPNTMVGGMIGAWRPRTNGRRWPGISCARISRRWRVSRARFSAIRLLVLFFHIHDRVFRAHRRPAT